MSSHVRLSVGAVFCVLWLIVLPGTLAAQSDATSGTIEGIVSDTTGAVLPAFQTDAIALNSWPGTTLESSL